MRAVLIFLCVIGAVCAYAAQQLDKWNKSGQRPAMMASVKPAATEQVVSSPYGTTVTLRSDTRGHFLVDARVDGRPVDFMVDTGASVIALRESSAAKLGIHPSRRDYTARATTANGVTAAAPVILNRVEIAGITVRDVRAFVMADEGLSTNLLGMSFLSKVKWTHDRGRLILEQ
jgi:aspartyl protease family protein